MNFFSCFDLFIWDLEQPQKGLLYVMLSTGAGRNLKIVEYILLLLVLLRLDSLILKK